MARARFPGKEAPGVKFWWASPDPDDVAHQIIELSYALEDFEKPMKAAAFLAARDVQTRFKTATDPIGRQWEPWSPNYAPWALKHTTGRLHPASANLHLTGEMERSVTGIEHWRPTDEGLFLDTSGFDEKWAWHNFGVEEDRGHGGKAQVSDVFGVVDRKANTLPERSFIGMSEPTRQKIRIAFNAWFVGEITIATSPKGTKFFRRVPTRV